MNSANGKARWTQRLGFAATILMLAAITLGAAFHVGSTMRIRRDAAIAETQSITNAVAEIRRALDQSRRFEPSILTQGTEAGGATHEAALDDAVAEIDTIIAITTDPILRGRAVELRGAILAYGFQFNEVVAALDAIGRDDDSGLRAVLRQSGKEAEARLSQIGAPALASLLKIIRQKDQDSLIQHGATYDSELTERKTAFEQALAASPIAPTAKNEIVDSVSTVFRHAVSLMEANLTLNAARDQLTALSTAIDSAVDALAANVETRRASLERDIEPSLVNPPKDVLAVIVIAMILMSLAMWMLSRWLLPPPAEGMSSVSDSEAARARRVAVATPEPRSAPPEGNAVATQEVWMAPQDSVRLMSRMHDMGPTSPVALLSLSDANLAKIDEDILELVDVASPISFDPASPSATRDVARDDLRRLTEDIRKAAENVATRLGAVQSATHDAVDAIQRFNVVLSKIEAESAGKANRAA